MEEWLMMLYICFFVFEKVKKYETPYKEMKRKRSELLFRKKGKFKL